MSCQEICDLLDGYVDGELRARESSLVREHLARCAACREEEHALRSLLAQAAALPRELGPGRELWSGIAPRLRRNVVGLRVRPSWLPAGLAAAAALLIAWSSLTSWQRGGDGGATRRNRTAATAPGSGAATPQPAAAGEGSSGLLEAEREYARATSDLLAAIEARRGALPKETLDAIDANVLLIDQALASLRAAVLSAPGNRDLEQLLAATHKRKVETLRRLARFSKI